MKIFYATNDYSHAFYDENRRLISAQTFGSDLFFMLEALGERVGFEVESKEMAETDGEFSVYLNEA